MGKKMKLPDFLSSTINKHHPWRQWPSCNHPKTLSYRFNSDDVFKTVNSVFFDQNDAVTAASAAAAIDTPESWFTNSSESASFSTESEDYVDGVSLETVVAGARSERRLFFEPGGHTSSILAKKSLASGGAPGDGDGDGNLAGDCRPLRESVALAMESDDPYGDFRRSMAEMVEINGVREWEHLEELLGWYLRMNGKDNHGFIVGAFVDLLVELASGNTGGGCNDTSTAAAAAAATTTTTAESFSSAVSRFSSSSDLGRNEIVEEERNLTR